MRTGPTEFSRVLPLTAWNVLAVAFNAGAGIAIARLLVPADRGLVAVIVSTAGLLSVATALGTNVTLRAQLPTNEGVNLSGFHRLSLRLLGYLGAPLFMLGGLVTLWMLEMQSNLGLLIALFVLFSVLSFLWFQTREALAAVGEISYGARVNTFGSLILFLFVLSGVLFGNVGVEYVVGCYLASLMIQFAVAYLRLRGHLGNEEPKGGRLLLRKGPVMLGYHFGQDIVFGLDRFLIGALSTTNAVGLYAVAATPAGLLRIPARSMGQYALLDAARGYRPDRRFVRRLVGLVAITALAVPALWLTAPWLLVFVFGQEYSDAVAPFRILLLAQVALVPYLITSRMLVGLGATWTAGVSGIFGVLTLAVVGFLVMPTLGAIGGAFAAAAAYLAMSIVSIALLFMRLRSASS